LPTISVAVVIPTLDEEEAVRQHLPAVLEEADEVLISDGGSTDDTVLVATEIGVRVVTGARGRGPQMNLGARHTSASALLFLHADSGLPTGAIDAIRQVIDTGRVGGGFTVLFDEDRWHYRLGSRLINLRTHLTHIPLGDQGQFVTRNAFDDLNGFRDWPILEDLDFMRRLKRQGPVTVLTGPVITSARRYVRGGVVRTLVNNWLIWLLYLVGVSPHRLARRYQRLG
jgi:rSAM/selenodomain-associated transferase 2